MLKGKTKVELFDAETGKLVKSVEKHNEITSAYQRLINHLFYSGYINSIARNDNSKLFLKDTFGGIIMFDSDVPDGAIVQDKTNHCTGMAFYNQSENNYDKVGSYNSKESSIDYDKKIATFVYDFTTSQANGVVKSICLCSKGITLINGIDSTSPTTYTGNYSPICFETGDMVYSNYSYPSSSTNFYVSCPLSRGTRYNVNNYPALNNSYITYVVFFDNDSGVRYGIRFDGNKKFYAVKQIVVQNKWSAFVDTSQSYWKEKYNVTNEETVEVDLSGIYGGFENTGNYVKCCITGYKGVMYIMPTVSTTQSGGTNLSILKYNFNNFGMESNEASFFNVLIPTGYSLWANYDAGFYVDSEYVYYVVTNGTDHFVAKSSMTNNADSKILRKISANKFDGYRCAWMPGVFIFSNYDNQYCRYYINLDDGSESYDATPSAYINSQACSFDFKSDYVYLCRSLGSDSNYYYYYYDYTLKSINNLNDAITKTNSNTMKITYTLTETDS